MIATLSWAAFVGREAGKVGRYCNIDIADYDLGDIPQEYKEYLEYILKNARRYRLAQVAHYAVGMGMLQYLDMGVLVDFVKSRPNQTTVKQTMDFMKLVFIPSVFREVSRKEWSKVFVPYLATYAILFRYLINIVNTSNAMQLKLDEWERSRPPAQGDLEKIRKIRGVMKQIQECLPKLKEKAQ